jgi:hypothetical protein
MLNNAESGCSVDGGLADLPSNQAWEFSVNRRISIFSTAEKLGPEIRANRRNKNLLGAVRLASCTYSAFHSAPLLSAVTGPVDIGPIPMRATALTGGSKPLLYCHNLHNTLCICVGDTIQVSHVAAGEHMVPGPFHSLQNSM